MSKTKYERGETLTYPRIYPKLTFTPVFGHRGDVMWIEEVKAAWPEHDGEFAFVRDTVHDERVDRLKEENERLMVENERLDDATLGAVLRMREATEALDRLVHALADADAENRKLKALVRDMWHDGMCDCDEFSHSIGVCVKCEYGYLERMRDLGIEVNG